MLRVPPKPTMPPFDTLVLSGGGIKGVATLGAVHRLKTRGALAGVRTVVGTSAGALVGALVATHADLMDSLRVITSHTYTPDFDFDRFFKDFGLDSGKSIDALVRSLLAEPYTFAGVRAAHGTTLVVCVTNLSRRRAVYLGPDTHPDMPVSLALRMSCSVPLYFSAVKYEGDWYADGSIVDNFPCNWALSNNLCTAGEAGRVLGITTRATVAVIKSFEAFVVAMLESASAGQAGTGAEVLDLDLPGVSALNFGAPASDLRRLFEAGVQNAEAFMKKRV
jgi:predicted patatin/cPLA2 family phospholipase